MIINEQHQSQADRVTPRCDLFGVCGGCAYQDLAYVEELRLKEACVRDTLQTLGVPSACWRPIVASPRAYHYRHRIDLKLQRTRQGILIGFTPKEGGPVMAVERCAIADERINDMIPAIKAEALEKITAKHRQANITIRVGDDGRVCRGGIGRHSLRMKPEDYLFTEINGRRLYFAMETFFQANLSILPALITHLRGLSIWTPRTRLFDCYGGVGLFSMNLYDLIREAVLIEQVKASIELARHNRQQLGASNVTILEGDVERHLPAHLGGDDAENVGIIDPPRAGLSEQAADLFARENGLRHLLYLSCNPASLARDCARLLEGGWTIREIQPFDFFPKTKHIETLVHLERDHGEK